MRLICYGDIHGCLREFISLRKKIGIQKGDIEVVLGDFIDKGRYSKETLRYLRRHNILAIRGNHEEKMVRYYQNKKDVKLDMSEKRLYYKLKRSDLEFLRSLPIYKKFGNIILLHAGITQEIELFNLSPEDIQTILTIRWVDAEGRYVKRAEKKINAYAKWSDLYYGHEGFIVYGHTPHKVPYIARHSIGIDTGCVYGNYLSALIFEHNEWYKSEPKYSLVQERARREYIRKEKW